MPIIFEDYRRRRARRRFFAVAAVAIAAGGGVYAGIASQRGSPVRQPYHEVQSAPATVPIEPAPKPIASATSEPSLTESSKVRQNCLVVDGDTLRCNGERIRLLGVDAPELPGHCRPGRQCVEGDPFAASAALKVALIGDDLRVQAVGFDRYGRTLANVYVNGLNISCGLISKGFVKYIERWDNGRLVARDCPELSL